VGNHIPIDSLMEDVLMLPAKRTDGHFRLVCPVCREFNTATNSESNLARCFVCSRNFNTIDIVMVYRKLSFVESVKFLKGCLDVTGKTPAHYRPMTPTSSNKIRGTRHPVAIHLVQKILSDKAPEVPSYADDIPMSPQQDFIWILARLEQKIESLSQQLTEIHQTVVPR
jgi:DNA primase